MCDPVTIATMVGTKLASAALENKAANEVDNERASALRANYKKLDESRSKSAQSYQQSIQKASKDTSDQDMERAVAERETAYEPKMSQTDLLPGQGDASAAVKMGVVNALGQGAQKASGNAKRRAAVDSYGDVSLGQNIALARNAGDISLESKNAQGTAALLPLQLNAAASAGDKYSGMADAVNALGTLATAGYEYGAGEGMWGGFDPKTGITWSSGHKMKAPAQGPVDPNGYGPYSPGMAGYGRV